MFFPSVYNNEIIMHSDTVRRIRYYKSYLMIIDLNANKMLRQAF